jgi:hypothetical protein
VTVIVRLQKAPNWRDRDEAATVLRHVDWRRRPEVLGALAYSLLHDPAHEVREEVAESLARMGACVPVVHEALKRAAVSDPHGGTRRWAKRGLRILGHRCNDPCNACGTAAAPIVLPGTILPEPILELSPAPGTVLEPLERPEPPINPAPFPGASPGAPIESRVSPPGDLEPVAPPAEEIAPLREPEMSDPIRRDDLKPLPDPPKSARQEPSKPARRASPPRPRIAIFLPRIFLPRFDR